MRDDRERLQDILEAIEKIDKYASQGRHAFDTDELIQSWIVNHLRILGEAARTLSPKTQQQFPSIPWSKIIGMRHVLIHNYFAIDEDIVWRVVEEFLPELKNQIKLVLAIDNDNKN
jgi:uncharacterized protein with HEPN domain